MQNLDLFKYTSFRTYLTDYQAVKKQAKKGWSYANWAKQMGVKSPATLAMIVNGQRNPGNDLTQNFCDYFLFTPKQSQYFHDLVELEKNKNNPRVSVLVLEKLSKLHPEKKFHVLDQKQFQAIANWYFYAIREMVQLKDFREDPEWISKKLSGLITPAKVRVALATLLSLDLLKRNKFKKLILSDAHADTSSDIADEGLRRFHEQVLSMAATSLRSTSPTYREVSGTTFSISLEKIPKAKELIREFRLKLCQLLEEPGADAVYQLEMAFFPLTLIEKDRNKTCH